MRWLAVLALGWLCFAAGAQIVVASTTSTEQSGLFAHLLPEFRKVTGVEVKVVALGTGQALDMGRRGDADVVFVHDRAQEERFVAEGHALRRYPVMYNDFVLVGPRADPAGVKGADIAAALGKIAASGTAFISRADRSGTHAAELRFRALAPVAAKGGGYRECGCGMGPALNIAASAGAYALADRATWLSFRNRGELAVLVEGDGRLLNEYGAMVVSPVRHPHVKAAQAQQFLDWLLSPAGQGAIAAYRIDGQQLFFPIR
ncbi:MAG: extracellular solute-binding protein [Ramlibacter sp.]|nr:extracellular solute-binding protein [Ramlibacter sp.]